MQLTRYPGLSHLFTPIEGGQKATPAIYTVAGHVAESVVNKLGSWIKRHARLPPFDSSEIGSTMSEIVAYGTAVVVEPER